MEKIKATITMGSDRQLHLCADNMNELVEKIMEWQDFDANMESLKSFGKLTPKRLEDEKHSGWYYQQNNGR